MKIFYLIFFLLFLSCSTGKKEYVCGDHLCVDKKEFNEFFSKNLIAEVKSQTNDKNKIIDLVKLNIKAEDKNNDNIMSKKEKKIKAKNEKKKLRTERIKLLEERKNKKLERKNKAKEDAKMAKISKSKAINKKVLSNKKLTKKNDLLINNTEEKISINRTKTADPKSICGEITDCDIEKISELLIKKGRDKSFPNITSN